MLVTIGILLVLAGLLLPMLSRATKSARRARAIANIQAISQGLEAYRLDQRDYPRCLYNDPNPPPLSGAELLCWALIAPGNAVAGTAGEPGDGANGPGFRTRGQQGQVYGPYIDPAKFRIQNVLTLQSTPTPPSADALMNDSQCVILDDWDHPIYYCPANPGASPSLNFVNKGAAGSALPFYDFRYFVESTAIIKAPPWRETTDANNGETISLQSLQAMLGDTNANGMIEPLNKEAAVYSGPFLLWSAGPNGFFGVDPQAKGTTSDDVTNFLP
jgi:type II secretory pathway pseudopilin PulG